jgi:hypothetical protein
MPSRFHLGSGPGGFVSVPGSPGRLATEGEMAIPTKSKVRRDIRPGIDITCIVGRVEFDDLGEASVMEAAFALIGRHDARGEYQIPMEDGRTMVVTVDYPDYDPFYKEGE